MTISELEKEGIESLTGAMVPDAAVDARALLMHAGNMKMSDLLLKRREEAPKELCDKFRQLIMQRCERVPLQHIIGETEFMGLPFYVNENVLCPRPDTEILIEKVVAHIKKDMPACSTEDIRILDLCTGSGCIITSILKLSGDKYEIGHSGVKKTDTPLFCTGRKITGVGTDLYEEALELARKNAWRNGIEMDRVQFCRGDLFEAVSKDERFDIIVSNPPYIPARFIDELMPEVRDHEPRSALDGGEDGLDFYRKISKEALGYFKEGGWLFFEIGFDQREDVTTIMSDLGYKDIGSAKDLSENDRVVWGHL